MASYFDEHDCEPLADGQAPNAMLMLARVLLDAGYTALWESQYARLFGGDRRNPPAAKKVIEELPKKPVSPSEAAEESECPICLHGLAEKEVISTLPCEHTFHHKCIVPWLQRVNSCPVCRHELPTDDEAYEEFKRQKAREKQRKYEMESLHDSMFG